MNKFEQQPIK